MKKVIFQLRTPIRIGLLFAFLLFAGGEMRVAQEWATKMEQRRETPDGTPLYTEFYPVPPTFLPKPKPAPKVDPFAVPGTQPKPDVPTAESKLEQNGITFPEGAFAFFDAETLVVTVHNTEEQLEIADIFFGRDTGPDLFRTITVIHERIEIEAAIYRDWQYENRIHRDGTLLRKTAQRWVKAGKGKILGTNVVAARSGQRARIGAYSEFLFPTEPGVGEVPAKVNVSGKDTNAPTLAATPSAFETRNLGTTIEVDPVLGADEFTVDLNFTIENSKQGDLSDWPQSEKGQVKNVVSTPRIRSEKFTNQITAHTGRYTFLGVAKNDDSPKLDQPKTLILNFLRADVGTVETPEPKSKRKWIPVKRRTDKK